VAVVSILPLRLYRVAAESLTKLDCDFYETVARLLFSHDPLTSLIGVPDQTIPLDHSSCGSSDLIAAAILRGYRRPAQEIDCLVIDLTNPPYRLLPDHHVIGGLLTFIEGLRKELPEISIALLMPVILAETDITMRALRPYLVDGRIGLISDDGSVSGTWPPLATFDGTTYAGALQAIRQTAVWLFKKKMIRRPGHFRRIKGKSYNHCLPFFFDGHFCQHELIALIAHHASAIIGNIQSPTIFYHCPESRWLYDAVISVCYTHEFRAIDAESTLRRSEEEVDVPDTCLLVVPLVDTRDTIRELLGALLARNASCRIHILTIITTQRFQGVEGNEVFETGGRKFPITYFLHADRPRISPSDCPACRIGLEEMNPGQADRYLKLTAYAMWNMFLESGMKMEENVPELRKSIGPVPDLPKMVQDNSPYLALKIDTMLRTRPGGLPVDPVILYPDETGAQTIADCLASLYDYTLIGIPRDVLKRLPKDGNFTLQWFDDRKHEATKNGWRYFVELSSLQTANRVHVILMDEFNKTGDTRARLEQLAHGFDLDVWCYFCLIDFLPSSRRQKGLSSLSLYDLELELAE
jgi:hypothetical protein